MNFEHIIEIVVVLVSLVSWALRVEALSKQNNRRIDEHERICSETNKQIKKQIKKISRQIKRGTVTKTAPR